MRPKKKRHVVLAIVGIVFIMAIISGINDMRGAAIPPSKPANTTQALQDDASKTTKKVTTTKEDVTTQAVTTTTTEEPSTTTEKPAPTTVEPTTTEEPITEPATEPTTIQELPTAVADLSKTVIAPGVQWKVDPEWREHSENGNGASFSYYPDGDNAFIMVILMTPKPGSLKTEDDFQRGYDQILDVIDASKEFELGVVREITDRNGSPAKEYKASRDKYENIQGSLSVVDETFVQIMGSSTTEDMSQVVKDMALSLEKSGLSHQPMKPMKFEGSGDDVILFDSPEHPFIIEIKGNSEGQYFGVWAHNSSRMDLLVNTLDPYHGTHLDVLNGTNELEITATGSWEVTLYDWSAMDVVSPGKTYEGSGDGVLYMQGVDESKPVTVTIEGNNTGEYFGVTEYSFSEDGGWRLTGLLVNTIDRYSGSVRARRGNTLYISASGSWTVEISQ